MQMHKVFWFQKYSFMQEKHTKDANYYSADPLGLMWKLIPSLADFLYIYIYELGLSYT